MFFSFRKNKVQELEQVAVEENNILPAAPSYKVPSAINTLSWDLYRAAMTLGQQLADGTAEYAGLSQAAEERWAEILILADQAAPVLAAVKVVEKEMKTYQSKLPNTYTPRYPGDSVSAWRDPEVRKHFEAELAVVEPALVEVVKSAELLTLPTQQLKNNITKMKAVMDKEYMVAEINRETMKDALASLPGYTAAVQSRQPLLAELASAQENLTAVVKKLERA